MSKNKSVTISVHRAFFSDNHSWTLAGLLNRLRSDLKDDDLIVPRSLFEKTAVKFPSFPKTNNAVAAQFGMYEEGAEKSTIQVSGTMGEYSTISVPAPDKAEFLSHEIAILTDENFMIACGLGQRQGIIIDAIGTLAKRCGINIAPTEFTFGNTPNRLTVEKIRRIGVKSIQFDAANLLGSLDISTESVIGSLFGKTSTREYFKRQEMIAELSIRPKTIGRPQVQAVAMPKNVWLEKAAVKTFEDDDVGSYTITLDDNSVWKEGDLKLSRTVDLPKDGSSFQVSKALQEMLDYLDQLKKGGHLK